MLPWVVTAAADPLATWRAAADTWNPVGLPEHVPAELRAEAQWLVALEGARAGDPLPMARWLAEHPTPSPLAEAAREWVLVAIRNQAFDRDADSDAVLDEVWSSSPWGGTVHEARLGLLYVLDRYNQPEPDFEARAAAAMSKDRAEVLPAFARRLLAPGPWGEPVSRAEVEWVRGELGPDGTWWSLPRSVASIAAASEVSHLLPTPEPVDQRWPPQVLPPAVAPRARPVAGSDHVVVSWTAAPRHLGPWLEAPDPAIGALWNDGRFREASRAAARWGREHPGEPQNWVRWARAWSRGSARGADELRAIVADPADPTYQWAATDALVEHLLAPYSALEAVPDEHLAEVAALLEERPDHDPARALFFAGWRLARGDRAGAERWAVRALDGTEAEERMATTFLEQNGLPLPDGPRTRWVDPGPVRDWDSPDRLCCVVGHPTPVLVAVGGTSRSPDAVPYVPRVIQDGCDDLTVWLHEVRPRLAACFRTASLAEGVWTVSASGTTGPDDAISTCLDALASDGPHLAFRVVARDLRRRSAELQSTIE